MIQVQNTGIMSQNTAPLPSQDKPYVGHKLDKQEPWRAQKASILTADQITTLLTSDKWTCISRNVCYLSDNKSYISMGFEATEPCTIPLRQLDNTLVHLHGFRPRFYVRTPDIETLETPL